MKLESKRNLDGEWRFLFKDEPMTREQCFALAYLICRMGDIKEIDVTEDHDAGDLYGSVVDFKSRSDLKKWADKLGDDYELDGIRIRIAVLGSDLEFSLVRNSVGALAGKARLLFTTNDEKVGDKVANTIVKNFK